MKFRNLLFTEQPVHITETHK